MSDVKVVSPPVGLKIIKLGGCAGLVRTAAQTFALAKGVLGIHCQPGTKASLQGYLKGIVVVVAARCLVVDLGKGSADRVARRRPAT